MKMQAITGKAMWYFPVFLDYGKRILLHSIGDHFVSAIATSDLLHTIGFDVFRVLLCVISDCSENLPLSVAYATWAGLGLALTSACAAIIFKEPFTAGKVGSLSLIIAGTISLNLAGAGH